MCDWWQLQTKEWGLGSPPDRCLRILRHNPALASSHGSLGGDPTTFRFSWSAIASKWLWNLHRISPLPLGTTYQITRVQVPWGTDEWMNVWHILVSHHSCDTSSWVLKSPPSTISPPRWDLILQQTKDPNAGTSHSTYKPCDLGKVSSPLGLQFFALKLE
jgi:hypothetical protein